MKLNYSQSLTPKHIDNKGFTLIELMIAVVLSALVLGTLGSSYIAQQRSATAQEQVAEVQQNIRAGLYILEHDIRMAGYDPLHTAGARITTAVANNLVFTMVVDTNGDGVINGADGLQTIDYRLYDAFGDGDLDLGRQVDAAAIQTVAENIDAIEFFYTMADGTQTLAPVVLGDIRAVQISILARAGRPDPEFTNSFTYIPGSAPVVAWDINGGTVGAGNPANDNFRRRLLVITIQCRNMGL